MDKYTDHRVLIGRELDESPGAYGRSVSRRDQYSDQFFLVVDNKFVAVGSYAACVAVARLYDV